MFRKFILIYVFLFSFYGFSQDKTGLVHYGEIQGMGTGAPVGPDYKSILVFNNSSSLYITRMDSLEGGHINSY